MQLLKPKTATSGQTTNESKGLIKVIGILLNAETIINVEEKKKFLEAQEKTLKKDGEKKAFKILKEAGLFDDSEEKETFLQRTFGKLDAFEDVTIPDPFINALV